MNTRDDWNYENAEVHEGEDEITSLYRVRFSAVEIARIRASARRRGVTAIEFIRKAAMERTEP